MKNLKQINSLLLVRAWRETSNKPRISRGTEGALRFIEKEWTARARAAAREQGLPESCVSTHRFS